ncbi:Type-1 restriction enzyme EcoKI specificity protein [Gimesia panareensis]|uniref:restriction endonuclease subunit S n=1 Tax=Gimesia panareensis TaxID=2527978 RepID=UPI001189D3C3|nr:restriction endonuclease subunit S [Gimesia panareensis]QDU53125.1 Type-1 restriction enzyme EcoKI specificity protein [Gimesia panareensis]
MSSRPYDQYKDSGVDWLGAVPSHWDVVPIKHIVATPVTDGPHETPEFINEGIPFVSAEAVSSGKIDFAKIRGYISQADHVRYCQKYKPQVGDVYMVKSGASTGTTAIVEDDREFSIWSPLAVIRCDENSYPRFVLNFLRSRNFQEGVTLNWSFGTQQNIGMNVIENLNITKPPLDEQKVISSFLDVETAKIDALVAEQQQLIELLKEKRQAVISHAVTKGLNPNAPMKDSGIEWLGDVPEHWEVMKLGRITLDRCDGPFGSGLKSQHYTDDGIRVVRLNNIRHNYFDGSDAAFIDSNYYYSELKGGHDVIAGDLLIAGLGDSNNAVGRACVAPDGIEPAMVKADCFRYRVDKSRTLANFVSAQLTVGAPTDAGLMSTGTTRSRMPLSVTSSRMIAFPSLAEQHEIVKFITERSGVFDSLVAEAEQAIELLQERRTALISAAVTGKIDVREYATQETA